MRINHYTFDERLGITWLTVHATEREMNRAEQWIDDNQTRWVMRGKRVADWPLDVGALHILKRIKTAPRDTPMRQNFGFKVRGDAMRFKLTFA